MRALVIEDAVLVRRLIARVLEERGWQVDAVADGASAVASLEAGPYDALVCDVNLGAEDGISLARRLKSRSPLTRVVIVSGLPENLERARSAGFELVLQKPFEPAELLTLIEEEGRCILLVEDDVVQLEELRHDLESFGWGVTPATSAEAGIEAARGGGFDLVLTDHVLPGMSGLRSICEYARLTPAPVVILTRDYSDSLAKDAALLGARRVLRKPLRAGALRDALEAALTAS